MKVFYLLSFIYLNRKHHVIKFSSLSINYYLLTKVVNIDIDKYR